MGQITKDLEDLTRRIDDGERRVERVRDQIARWSREGRDTTQARELLSLILDSLRQLYSTRAIASRYQWIIRNGSGNGQIRGLPTFMVVARCSATGQDVPTGIIMDFPSFNRLIARHPTFICPACAGTHEWSIGSARLRPSSSLWLPLHSSRT